MTTMAYLFFRWSPFRRSAYIRSIGVQKEPEDKKFFRSLTKPKQYNSHLEPLSEIGNVKSSLDSGFVFRSLPVYRVSHLIFDCQE